jgi:hypothetical protein
MKFMQPNENASRDLWIRFLEGDWQNRILGRLKGDEEEEGRQGAVG